MYSSQQSVINLNGTMEEIRLRYEKHYDEQRQKFANQESSWVKTLSQGSSTMSHQKFNLSPPITLPTYSRPPQPPDPPDRNKQRLQEVGFPKFDGTNLWAWIRSCEEHFYLNQTELDLKVHVASPHIVGKALEWHINYLREHYGMFPSWTNFVIALSAKFGGLLDDSISELMNLKQAGDSVEVYLGKFERILTNLSLPMHHKLSIFLKNMVPYLAEYVKQYCVTTVAEAARLAKLHESSHYAPLTQARAPFNPYREPNIKPHYKSSNTIVLPPPKPIEALFSKANSTHKYCEKVQEKRKELHMFCGETYTPQSADESVKADYEKRKLSNIEAEDKNETYSDLTPAIQLQNTNMTQQKELIHDAETIGKIGQILETKLSGVKDMAVKEMIRDEESRLEKHRNIGAVEELTSKFDGTVSQIDTKTISQPIEDVTIKTRIGEHTRGMKLASVYLRIALNEGTRGFSSLVNIKEDIIVHRHEACVHDYMALKVLEHIKENQEYEMHELAVSVFEVDCSLLKDLLSQSKVHIPLLELNLRCRNEFRIEELYSGENSETIFRDDKVLLVYVQEMVVLPKRLTSKCSKSWKFKFKTSLEKYYKPNRLLSLLQKLHEMSLLLDMKLYLQVIVVEVIVSALAPNGVIQLHQTGLHVWHRWKNKDVDLDETYAVSEFMMLYWESFQSSQGNGVVGLASKVIQAALFGSFSGGVVLLVCSRKGCFLAAVYDCSIHDQVVVCIELELNLKMEIHWIESDEKETSIADMIMGFVYGTIKGFNELSTTDSIKEKGFHGNDSLYEHKKVSIMVIEASRKLKSKEFFTRFKMLCGGERQCMKLCSLKKIPLLDNEVFHLRRPPTLLCKENEVVKDFIFDHNEGSIVTGNYITHSV